MLLLTYILVATFFNIAIANDAIKPELRPKSAPKVKPTFKDLLEKYEPSTVWERLDMLKMTKSINLTTEGEINYLLDGMDSTDELLRLKVVNGNASVPLKQDGRRYWSPEGIQTLKIEYDHWQLLGRLHELMKQAIYQTRNKMVIMQPIRDKFRAGGLYKMGFLIARCDSRSKTFASFAFKALQHCHLQEQHGWIPWSPLRIYYIDVVYSIERSLHTWFEMDLLYELLEKNHDNAKSIVSKYATRKKKILTDTFIW